jgi:ubiquinone biosynthesis protein UbiJ
MASMEFFLIRLTAQSKGSDPKEPGGGAPKYSPADVQMIVACVESLPAYYAAMAKVSGDERAAVRLLEMARMVSENEWRKNPRNREIRHTLNELDRVVEIAVLMFLNPHNKKGEPRTEEWMAKYVGVAWRTWKQNYKDHQTFIQQQLQDFYQRAQADIYRFTRENSPTVEKSVANGLD